MSTGARMALQAIIDTCAIFEVIFACDSHTYGINGETSEKQPFSFFTQHSTNEEKNCHLNRVLHDDVFVQNVQVSPSKRSMYLYQL